MNASQTNNARTWKAVSASLAIAGALFISTTPGSAMPVIAPEAVTPPEEAAPLVKVNSGCRHSTFGDLARWMHARTADAVRTYDRTGTLAEVGTYSGEWTRQYFGCGVMDLPANQEAAFNNMVETGDFSHPIASRRTGSGQPLTNDQRNMKACAQAMAQVDAYRQSLADIDPSYKEHREMGAILRQGIESNNAWINSNCR